ncbi:hypothetical protein EDB81DRAFT_108182 [Dactylonectria macrodidyma]|uniref:DUF7707 domain-containing protein n=1 Tax=Dactylonectria macrodidyma TaxID=307937 RepID=A0A9P9E6X8_9HYPO|nr:hypothetical protein EDB81DRAFT_108182 [Dactylonectria macrodidyma]
MRFSLTLLTVAVGAVSAQVANYTSSLNMTIDPNTVEAQERASWCQAQTNTCELLCDNNTGDNSCTQSDLSWECTCASNSSTPGLQYYTQTVPTFICEELYSQCIASNTGSASSQRECTSNIGDLCATQGPPDVDDSEESSSTTESQTATASATKSSGTSEATGDSVTSTSSDGFAAPTMAPAGKGAAAAVAIGMLAYLV